LLVAGRVARQVEVLLVSTRSADADAPNGPGTRVLSYRVLDLAAGDPRGLTTFLERAFTRCAHATPSRIGGVDALVGSGRSDYGASAAEVVLLRSGARIAWAVVDGLGWTPDEQARAVGAVAGLLTGPAA
ncbi:MAG: hypothetical protein ABIS35_05810, partial [Terracoccus sp.]